VIVGFSRGFLLHGVTSNRGEVRIIYQVVVGDIRLRDNV